ncbi:GNAT family N-acetyltransferase [Candidatus Poribacteria bacterium]|nr:GNAT family N-acetyltransferase [Candidatus Poribacteria bacterium]MYG07846.1 GNAT family N-acetyltransferase [Candidatus Poribacteria bacterium]MYK23872.1 GNAT family N-acetyltransferase [Candidatus Poribacteria bacterium]
MTKLIPQECLVLSDVIGDTPTTVISASRLKQGACSAYVVGTLPDVTAALVFDAYCPDEPSGFGTDAEALWQLLKATDGWSCINVDTSCATSLGALIEADRDTTIRYYGDVYHALLKPVHCYPNKVVRLLTPEDGTRLAKAPAEVQGNGYKTHTKMITDGIAAGAIVDNNIVAIAHTYAENNLHADIGVSTIETWREKGFATAAAALVAQEIQARGKVPVWSCGEDNIASLRVAQKLGFTEVGRRTYVIPTSPE